MGEDLWNHKVDNSFLVYVTMYCTFITVKRMESTWTVSVWTKAKVSHYQKSSPQKDRAIITVYYFSKNDFNSLTEDTASLFSFFYLLHLKYHVYIV